MGRSGRPARAARLGLAPHDLEPERAGERRRLDETDLDRATQAERLLGPRPDQRPIRLLEAVIVVAQGRGGHEAVPARLGEPHEEAGARDAADARLKDGADAVGQMRRDEAVDRLAFRRHRPPLGGRDMLGDLREFARAHVVEAAIAEVQGADQRAMDDEIGVAPDGGSEMRVAAQVEAEMAIVLVAVFGLRLGAQHHLVDQRLDRLPAHAAQDAVEMRGANAVSLSELDADGAQELDEIVELLGARRVMGAIEKRRMRGLERLGGGDIGEDHEFLDQPMRFQPLGPVDAHEASLAVENELALRQIEVERIAPLTLKSDRRMRGPERLEQASRSGAVVSSGRAVDRRLSLLVGKPARPNAS